MEIWDLYDEHRNRTGKSMVRGDGVPAGYYHLVVDALFLNSRGETLMQRRAAEKETLPGIWSFTGGSALRGEDSAAACVREVTEEMGFVPDLARGRVILTQTRPDRGCIRDVYLIAQDVPLDQMQYQPGEVDGAMWILPENIAADPALWAQADQMSYWGAVYPYLWLESMRVRIPRGVYRHYKGNRYEVEGLCLHSETVEPMVIYRALYGMGEKWVRPARMWNEEVTLPNGEKTLRFARET